MEGTVQKDAGDYIENCCKIARRDDHELDFSECPARLSGIVGLKEDPE